MIFFYAFLVGGLICMLAQLVQDIFRFTPGHVTAIFVICGALLEFFNIYDNIIVFSEAGALLPITNFGHSLAHSAYISAKEEGFFGLFTGLYNKTAGGISLAIILSLFVSLISKPKD